jgi:TolB-like protein/Flp pilus assembly protein TadD
MAEERVQRRLAAVLIADVVGYSRLMEADEAGTLAALKERRKGTVEPLVREHKGRIVKVMGDGVLVEFASAVNALACAIALQKAMAEVNAGLPENRRIEIRIGINLSDLIGEGSDIYGDGVNVAARLESLAVPGGICVSSKVHDEVSGKLPFMAEDLGEVSLKNISRPIRAYRIEPESVARSVAGFSNAADERPSIAVLPFANMSGDPNREYFSDGITEDIITELSRYRPLFVIARNSSFQFRGPGVDIGEVRRRLGVRYVVEGSVRLAGHTIRVTAQLIDAKAGGHIWAERYDRPADEVFDIQDEVVRMIVGTLIGRLEDTATSQSRRRPPQSLAAYDWYLRAFEEFWRLYGDMKAYFGESTGQAVELCEQALRLDSSYSRAHACLALIHMLHFWHRGRADALDHAFDCAKTAVSLDENDGFCQHILGIILLRKRDYDLAETHFRRAVALNPNDSMALTQMAQFFIHTGQPKAAFEWIERSMQLDPLHRVLNYEMLGMAQYLTHRFEEAAASFRQLRDKTNWDVYLAAALAQAGQIDAARAEMTRYAQRAAEIAASATANEPVLQLMNASLIADLRTFKNPADVELVLGGLRKAGFDV